MNDPRTAAIAAFAADLRAQFGDDDDLIADMLEGETDLHDMIGRLLRAEAEADAFADANKAIAAEYTARAKALGERKEGIRRALLALVNITGLKSLKHDLATLTVKAVAPQAELYGDPEALPEDMQRWKCAADLNAIKAAIEAGQDVPGARLTNGGETIQVRRK